MIKYSVAELSSSLSSYLYAEQNQEVLDSIMARNVSSLTPSELVQFYSIKEAQYGARRARVQAYCRTQQGGNFSRRIYQYLLYDKKVCIITTILKLMTMYLLDNQNIAQDEVSACTIAKVAGTTWHEHFLALGSSTTLLIIPFLLYFSFFFSK